MKILFVSPDIPFPPNHGGRIDVWDQIRAFCREGHTVDLVFTYNDLPLNDHMKEIKKITSNVWQVRRTRTLLDIFSPSSFQVASRKNLETANFSGHNYDVVILETEYVARILKNKSLHSKKFFLRIQNDESYYFMQLAISEKNIFRKLIFILDSYKIKRISRKVFENMDSLLFISQKDLVDIVKGKDDLRRKSFFIPPPVETLDYKICNLEGFNVLFVGSFFMPNNRNAVTWYIKNVHQNIKNESYKIIIAGNSRGESLNWLKNLTKNFSNVEIIDSPKDLQPIYSKSRVFINPMLYGSGIKMKTVQALMNGLPVVSTSVGAEGTGLIDKRHIMITDDPLEFADRINEYLRNTDLATSILENAKEYLSEKFDFIRNMENVFKEMR